MLLMLKHNQTPSLHYRICYITVQRTLQNLRYRTLRYSTVRYIAETNNKRVLYLSTSYLSSKCPSFIGMFGDSFDIWPTSEYSLKFKYGL